MILKKDLWMKYHLNFPISGGDGSSKVDAIKILLTNKLGILLEKDLIACLYCNGDYSFELIEQKCINDDQNNYDLLAIKLQNGEVKDVYFEISNFFGESSEFFNRDSKAYLELLKRMTIRPDRTEELSWFE